MPEVKVPFNQQQLKLIERLLEKKNFGESNEEVVRTVFKEWMKEAGFLDN